MAIKDANTAINLNLSETWLRYHQVSVSNIDQDYITCKEQLYNCLLQVLPERTHPTVNMSGGGGYLLTGIRIIS